MARPDRMYGNIARCALAHDRMFASTGHCSRRTAHWSTSSGHLERDSDDSSPRTADLSPDTADLSPDTADLSPLTADLSLDPDHVDHSTARSTTAPAQSKHAHGDVNASPHRSVIPLGHRADAHGGRSHSARHTTRSKGHMRFLQNAVLAALKRCSSFSTTMPRCSPPLLISPRLGNGAAPAPANTFANRLTCLDPARAIAGH